LNKFEDQKQKIQKKDQKKANKKKSRRPELGRPIQADASRERSELSSSSSNKYTQSVTSSIAVALPLTLPSILANVFLRYKHESFLEFNGVSVQKIYPPFNKRFNFANRCRKLNAARRHLPPDLPHLSIPGRK
jgi:hypothetical protein